MKEQKTVKIVGLSVGKNLGSLRATELIFDENNLLTVIKGKVGAGKSTLQKALKLTTAGSKTLEDKNLYGEVDLVAKLVDGENNIFVGCRTNKDGSGLDYFLYTEDEDGKKVKEPVIDGKKATPAAYLSSLQTALTWRLNELTSENSKIQRDILLELYPSEMEDKGVIFNKSHPKYVGSIIDLIEKAKYQRSVADMKRKEVGGIADDLSKKGINFKERRTLKNTEIASNLVAKIKGQIENLKANPQTAKDLLITNLRLEGVTANTALRNVGDKIKEANKNLQILLDSFKFKTNERDQFINNAKGSLQQIAFKDEFYVQKLFEGVLEAAVLIEEPKEVLKKELTFNEKGSFIGKIEDFEDLEIQELIKTYSNCVNKFITANNSPIEEVNTEKENEDLKNAEKVLNDLYIFNKEVLSVNAFHDWQDANFEVNQCKKDYFNKLTEINTGVAGLTIAPEFIVDANGDKIAKDDADIYLYYNGEYNTEYFNNPKKEIRKLSSHSGTQKPMVCLLIQEYLLSKKPKALRYLWIDDVPLDISTRILLEKMSKELDLHLFVNWTGDFDIENLQDGEILIENGEVFGTSVKE